MKDKFVKAYMDVAERFAQLSSAERLQVGAIIVKDDRIISIGYNGMPSGWDNECEITLPDGRRVSKPEVLHAESNALAKLAKCSESGDGATIFITHSPCIECSKLIYQSGIRNVYYRSAYRSIDGLTFLENSGLTVLQV